MPRPSSSLIDASSSINNGDEFVVILKESSVKRVLSRTGYGAHKDLRDLRRLVQSYGFDFLPLVDEHLARTSDRRTFRSQIARLSRFYYVDGPLAEIGHLATAIKLNPLVASAFIKPAPSLASLNNMEPSRSRPPPSTPNYDDRTGYLDPAPFGIDARYAWALSGGLGDGVTIVDLEWGWNLRHENLRWQQCTIVGGSPSAERAYCNHGTAVLGILHGDHGPNGTKGICPKAIIHVMPLGSARHHSVHTSIAMLAASEHLKAGDILLIEVQRNYLPIEWWPDDFEVIRAATARGILVVEPAGNAGVSLESRIYNSPPQDFEGVWTNPFQRGEFDSGAIIVGAGAPPTRTHDRSLAPNCSRLGFSNFGAMVDVQSWGQEVTTTGYGDLQGGPIEDRWYSDRFSGTSAAAAIVAGGLACVQGILKTRKRPVLTYRDVRRLLTATGHPQDGRSKHQPIGNRLDLLQIIRACCSTQVVGSA